MGDKIFRYNFSTILQQTKVYSLVEARKIMNYIQSILHLFVVTAICRGLNNSKSGIGFPFKNTKKRMFVCYLVQPAIGRI